MKKLHIDNFLFFYILALLIYGILIIWSASNGNFYIIKWKIFQIVIGIFVVVLLSHIPPKIYEISALYIYIFCILLLLVVMFFGKVNKGAQRWLEIGCICFQPSEIAKIFIPLMVAKFIQYYRYPLVDVKCILYLLILLMLPVFLVMLQPDLGTAILIILSSLLILLLSGINWKVFFYITLALFFCFFFVLFYA